MNIMQFWSKMNKIRNLLLFIVAMISFLPSCVSTPDIPHPFRGVNLVGGELVWGKVNTDNPVVNQDYLFVSNQDIDYLVTKKIGFTRLLVSWEALQPVLNQPFSNGTYASTFKSRVDYATSKNLNVMIEIHGGLDTNFAKYKGNLVGSSAVPNAAFADFWKRMAETYKNNPKVMYGLSNEPHNMSTTQWFSAAQTAISSIRSTGSKQMIFIPGNGWTGATSWTDNWYDTDPVKVSNTTAFLSLQDPAKNLVASIHVYLDTNASGAGDDVVSPTIGVERLTKVVNWAKSNGVKLHLSEIGANAANPAAKLAVQNLLNYIQANNTVVIGWSWWAYGPPSWWSGYKFTLAPKSNYTVEDPKFAWLAPYLIQPAPQMAVDAGQTVDAAVPVSATFPSKPITFTKNVVFTMSTVATSTTNWVYVPNLYDSTHKTPTKLFVWLHGCGGQSQYDVSMVSFMSNQDWVSLAPGGRETTCWSNVTTDGPKILAAIEEVRSHFNIDPKRIVLGGYSSGGDIGYVLAMQNSKLFAGVLFENTTPNAAALTLAGLPVSDVNSPKKFNIVHLHHLRDTTYPITKTRANMTLLKSYGFPVTLLEKDGTHWDNDNGSTGTSYDLRTLLLPHLNDSWLSLPVVDAGVDASSAIDASAKYDASTDAKPDADSGADSGVVLLRTWVRTTYNWGSGYCEEIDLANKSSQTLTWSEFKVNMRGGVIRDQSLKGPPWDTWNASFSSRKDVVTIRPFDWNKSVPKGGRITVGFCADFGPQLWTGTLVLGSLVP